MMRLTSHKKMLSIPIAFGLWRTLELMEEIMVLLETLENSLPSSVSYKAEVVELWQSREGGSLASDPLDYSRKGAYHALLLRFNSCNHKARLVFFKKHFLKGTQRDGPIHGAFKMEEPKGAYKFGKLE